MVILATSVRGSPSGAGLSLARHSNRDNPGILTERLTKTNAQPPKHAFETTGLCLARIGLDGRILEASPALCEMLDHTADSFVGKYFSDIFSPAAEQDESLQGARLIDGDVACYASERRITTDKGHELLVRVVFWTERNTTTGKAVAINAIVDDMTAASTASTALREADEARRELARRLTSAQESERTRIARELHDDIGQSLAILRIQMMRAGRPVSGMPGKLHPSLPELSEQLKDIAQKVSSISHQLHSTELEYLGLSLAVQSHCREFTAQYKIPVRCTCQDISAGLDRLIALGVLRVIQEALHNAGKYSRAKQIEVTLKGTATHLSLVIADDGVGFDVEEARLAAGLGLISMRERIKLAGGEYAITSTPGSGTRIMARVPINASH